MTRKHSLTVRFISLLLAFTFLLSEISYAAPAVSLPTGSVAPLQLILNEPSRFEVPAQFAHLQEIHKAEPKTNNVSPLIIHIQDAHVNLSGQQNLANALDDIMSKYKISLVLVEGGSRDDTLTPIKSVAPPEVWKKVAKKFLIEGKISGEEYLNLISDHPMTIMGIEDKALYMKSLEAYAALAGKRDGALEYLKLIEKNLEKLKNKMYPKELLEYEYSVRNNRSPLTANRNSETGYKKLIELAQSLRHPQESKDPIKLSSPSVSVGDQEVFDSRLKASGNDMLSNFPTVQKLIAVQENEKHIDFNLANLEQASLVEEISKKGDGVGANGRSPLQDFLEKISKMKNSKLSQYAYFQNTFNIAKDKHISLDQYPNLALYGQYLKVFSELDLDTLIDDMEKLEDEVYLDLLHDRDARLVRSIDRYIHLLQTAYQIQMSTKEFDLFKTNESDFSTESYLAFINRKLAELGYFEDLIAYDHRLDDAKKLLESFYDAVTQRDFAFIKNTEKILNADVGATGRSPLQAAIMITGGYHTQHLKKLFKEKDYSYIVLSPIVTSETNQAKYEKLLLEPIRKTVKTITVSENSSSPQSLGGDQTPSKNDENQSSLEDDLIQLKKKNNEDRPIATAEAGARLSALVNEAQAYNGNSENSNEAAAKAMLEIMTRKNQPVIASPSKADVAISATEEGARLAELTPVDAFAHIKRHPLDADIIRKSLPMIIDQMAYTPGESDIDGKIVTKAHIKKVIESNEGIVELVRKMDSFIDPENIRSVNDFTLTRYISAKSPAMSYQRARQILDSTDADKLDWKKMGDYAFGRGVWASGGKYKEEKISNLAILEMELDGLVYDASREAYWQLVDSTINGSIGGFIYSKNGERFLSELTPGRSLTHVQVVSYLFDLAFFTVNSLRGYDVDAIAMKDDNDFVVKNPSKIKNVRLVTELPGLLSGARPVRDERQSQDGSVSNGARLSGKDQKPEDRSQETDVIPRGAMAESGDQTKNPEGARLATVKGSKFSDVGQGGEQPVRDIEYFAPFVRIVNQKFGQDLSGKNFVELGATGTSAVFLDLLRSRGAKVTAVGHEVEGIEGDVSPVSYDYKEFWEEFNRRSSATLDGVFARLSLYPTDPIDSILADYAKVEKLFREKEIYNWLVDLILERNYRDKYLPINQGLRIGGILIRAVHQHEKLSVGALDEKRIHAYGFREVHHERFEYLFPHHRGSHQSLFVQVLEKQTVVGLPIEPRAEFTLIAEESREEKSLSIDEFVEFVKTHPALSYWQDASGRWHVGTPAAKSAFESDAGLLRPRSETTGLDETTPSRSAGKSDSRVIRAISFAGFGGIILSAAASIYFLGPSVFLSYLPAMLKGWLMIGSTIYASRYHGSIGKQAAIMAISMAAIAFLGVHAVGWSEILYTAGGVLTTFAAVFISKRVIFVDKERSLVDVLYSSLRWSLLATTINRFHLYMVFMPFILGPSVSGFFLRTVFDLGVASNLVHVPLATALGVVFGERINLWDDIARGNFKEIWNSRSVQSLFKLYPINFFYWFGALLINYRISANNPFLFFLTQSLASFVWIVFLERYVRINFNNQTDSQLKNPDLRASGARLANQQPLTSGQPILAQSEVILGTDLDETIWTGRLAEALKIYYEMFWCVANGIRYEDFTAGVNRPSEEQLKAFAGAEIAKGQIRWSPNLKLGEGEQVTALLKQAAKIGGVSAEEIMPSSIEYFKDRIRQAISEGRIMLLPGAENLLKKYSQSGRVYGLSLAAHDTLSEIADALGIKQYFTENGLIGVPWVVNTPNDAAENFKPSRIVEISHRYPGSVFLMLGDSPGDVKAVAEAKKRDSQIRAFGFGVTTGNYPEAALKDAGAAFVVPTLGDNRLLSEMERISASARLSKKEVGDWVVHTLIPQLGTGQIIEIKRGSAKVRFPKHGSKTYSLSFLKIVPSPTDSRNKSGARLARERLPMQDNERFISSQLSVLVRDGLVKEIKFVDDGGAIRGRDIQIKLHKAIAHMDYDHHYVMAFEGDPSAGIIVIRDMGKSEGHESSGDFSGARLADVGFGTFEIPEIQVEKQTYKDLNGKTITESVGLKKQYLVSTSTGRQIFISDDHQWALYAWLLAYKKGHISTNSSLLHIDEHPDDQFSLRAFRHPIQLSDVSEGNLPEIGRIIRDYYRYDSFIAPAVSMGLVDPDRWFFQDDLNAGVIKEEQASPQEPLENTPLFKFVSGFERLSIDSILPNIDIVDLDIDVFAPLYRQLTEKESAEKARAEILGKWVPQVAKILAHGKTISIATSPGYIDQDLAVEIVKKLLEDLRSNNAGARLAKSEKQLPRKLEQSIREIKTDVKNLTDTSVKIKEVFLDFKKAVWRKVLWQEMPRKMRLYSRAIDFIVRDSFERVSEIHPILKKAVLLKSGSYAREHATSKSDVDLFLVVPNELKDDQEMQKAAMALVYFLTDVVGLPGIQIYSLDEFGGTLNGDLLMKNPEKRIESATESLDAKFAAGDQEEFYNKLIQSLKDKQLATHGKSIIRQLILERDREYSAGSKQDLFKMGLGGTRESNRSQWLAELAEFGQEADFFSLVPQWIQSTLKSFTIFSEERKLKEAFFRQAARRNESKRLETLTEQEQIQYMKDALVLFGAELKLMRKLWSEVRLPDDSGELGLFLASPDWESELSLSRKNELLENMKKSPIVVEILPTKIKGITEIIFLLNVDRVGLLGELSGILASRGLSIEAAQIDTPNGKVFNHFWVKNVPETDKGHDTLIQEIKQDVRTLVGTEKTIEELFKERGVDYVFPFLGAPGFVPTIVVIEEKEGSQWLTFLTQQRSKPGLRSLVARWLGEHGVSIRKSAAIKSQGKVVFDSLAIAETDGKKLSEERHREIILGLKEFLSRPEITGADFKKTAGARLAEIFERKVSNKFEVQLPEQFGFKPNDQVIFSLSLESGTIRLYRRWFWDQKVEAINQTVESAKRGIYKRIIGSRSDTMIVRSNGTEVVIPELFRDSFPSGSVVKMEDKGGYIELNAFTGARLADQTDYKTERRHYFSQFKPAAGKGVEAALEIIPDGGKEIQIESVSFTDRETLIREIKSVADFFALIISRDNAAKIAWRIEGSSDTQNDQNALTNAIQESLQALPIFHGADISIGTSLKPIEPPAPVQAASSVKALSVLTASVPTHADTTLSIHTLKKSSPKLVARIVQRTNGIPQTAALAQPEAAVVSASPEMNAEFHGILTKPVEFPLNEVAQSVMDHYLRLEFYRRMNERQIQRAEGKIVPDDLSTAIRRANDEAADGYIDGLYNVHQELEDGQMETKFGVGYAAAYKRGQQVAQEIGAQAPESLRIRHERIIRNTVRHPELMTYSGSANAEEDALSRLKKIIEIAEQVDYTLVHLKATRLNLDATGALATGLSSPSWRIDHAIKSLDAFLYGRNGTVPGFDNAELTLKSVQAYIQSISYVYQSLEQRKELWPDALESLEAAVKLLNRFSVDYGRTIGQRNFQGARLAQRAIAIEPDHRSLLAVHPNQLKDLKKLVPGESNFSQMFTGTLRDSGDPYVIKVGLESGTKTKQDLARQVLEREARINRSIVEHTELRDNLPEDIAAGQLNPADMAVLNQLFSSGLLAQSPFLSSRRIHGESVKQFFERVESPLFDGRRQEIDRQVLAIFKAAVQGITVFHNYGIIHRDLGPQEIFIEDGQGVKIRFTDFALASTPTEFVPVLYSSFFKPGWVNPLIEGPARDMDSLIRIFAVYGQRVPTSAISQPLGALESLIPKLPSKDELHQGAASVSEEEVRKIPTASQLVEYIGIMEKSLTDTGEHRLEGIAAWLQNAKAGVRLAIVDVESNGIFTPKELPIIIVAEDNPNDQELYRWALQSDTSSFSRYQFVFVNNREALYNAISIAQRAGLEVRVISDNDYPKTASPFSMIVDTGQELAADLLARKIPFVLLSGAGIELIFADNIEAMKDRYVSKGIAHLDQRFLEALHKVLALPNGARLSDVSLRAVGESRGEAISSPSATLRLPAGRAGVGIATSRSLESAANHARNDGTGSFQKFYRAQLSQNQLTKTNDADSDTLDLLARVYLGYPRITHDSAVKPFSFKLGNALVAFEEKENRIRVNLYNLSLDGQTESIGFIDITDQVTQLKGPSVVVAETTQKLVSEVQAPLEAVVKTESTNRFAEGIFKEALASIDKNVVLSIRINKENINSPEGQAELRLITESVAGIKSLLRKNNVYFEAVDELGNIYPDLFDGAHAFKEGNFEHLFVSVPTQALLSRAQFHSAGFMSLQQPRSKDEMMMVPYKAVFIVTIMAAHAEHLVKGSGLDRLLNRLLLKNISESDYQAIRRVERVDVMRYLGLAVQLIPLKINEFLKAATLALKAVDTAA